MTTTAIPIESFNILSEHDASSTVLRFRFFRKGNVLRGRSGVRFFRSTSQLRVLYQEPSQALPRMGLLRIPGFYPTFSDAQSVLVSELNPKYTTGLHIQSLARTGSQIYPFRLLRLRHRGVYFRGSMAPLKSCVL